MNRILLYGVCLVAFFSTQVCIAKFYQYKNAAGTLVFTDDLSQIPVDQRPKMTSHESVKKKEGSSNKPAMDKNRHSDAKRLRDRTAEKERTWFKEEEKRLNRERNTLLILKKDINTPEKQENYNKRVRALNQKIDAYKSKLEQLKKRLGQ